MTREELITVKELSRLLERDESETLRILRQSGARGIVRVSSGDFRIPLKLVPEIRASLR